MDFCKLPYFVSIIWGMFKAKPFDIQNNGYCQRNLLWHGNCVCQMSLSSASSLLLLLFLWLLLLVVGYISYHSWKTIINHLISIFNFHKALPFTNVPISWIMSLVAKLQIHATHHGDIHISKISIRNPGKVKKRFKKKNWKCILTAISNFEIPIYHSVFGWTKQIRQYQTTFKFKHQIIRKFADERRTQT